MILAWVWAFNLDSALIHFESGMLNRVGKIKLSVRSQFSGFARPINFICINKTYFNLFDQTIGISYPMIFPNVGVVCSE